jgi:hypothetical protein
VRVKGKVALKIQLSDYRRRMVAPKQSTAVQEEELGLAEKLISSTSIIYQV